MKKVTIVGLFDGRKLEIDRKSKNAIAEHIAEKPQEMIMIAGEYVRPQAISGIYESERELTEKEKIEFRENNKNNHAGVMFGFLCKYDDCGRFIDTSTLPHKKQLYMRMHEVRCAECDRFGFFEEVAREQR